MTRPRLVGEEEAAVAGREALMSQTFVEVADTLVADFDVVDVLTTLAGRCVELFDVDEAGLMLADDGALQVAASSSQTMRLLELFELQHDEGPCVDCYREGVPVECADLESAHDRWPVFASEALEAGIGSVFAVPLRLREQTIGSLNLLRKRKGLLDRGDLAAAQAVADVATIGILQHRVAAERKLLAEQLQGALQSRIVIEQAKGVLAATTGLSVDATFDVMRAYARSHGKRLADVAAAVVSRELSGDQIVLA
jgi:GAF domain-containing protein